LIAIAWFQKRRLNPVEVTAIGDSTVEHPAKTSR